MSFSIFVLGSTLASAAVPSAFMELLERLRTHHKRLRRVAKGKHVGI